MRIGRSVALRGRLEPHLKHRGEGANGGAFGTVAPLACCRRPGPRLPSIATPWTWRDSGVCVSGGEAEASDVLVTFYSETHLCGTITPTEVETAHRYMSCLVWPRRFVRRGSRGERGVARACAHSTTVHPRSNGAFTTCSCSSVAWRTLALAIYCHRQARERVSRHTRVAPPPLLAHPQFSINHNCSHARARLSEATRFVSPQTQMGRASFVGQGPIRLMRIDTPSSSQGASHSFLSSL